MDKVEIELIKNISKKYKQFYPCIFNTDVPKSEEFRTFLSNSREDLMGTISNIGIDSTDDFLYELLDGFDKRILGNDTGCSVLRHLFYISLTEAIMKKLKLKEIEGFVVDVDKGIDLREILGISQDRDEWKSGNKWYRGQNNYVWDLFPSFFRNTKSKLYKIDRGGLLDDYRNIGLVDRASNTIGYSSIDYNFISYMQHAVSFSPLIDFTQNPIVAIVMALSDTADFREHYNNDSSLFELVIDEHKVLKNTDAVDRIIDNYVVYYSQSFPFLETLTLEGKSIVINSFTELIKALTPNCTLIEIPTNDRMRYQSGKFVLCHNCLILDKKVYLELNPDIRITKYRLKKSIKQRTGGKASFLDKLLKDYPEFSYSNMMNPYEWFGR